MSNREDGMTRQGPTGEAGRRRRTKVTTEALPFPSNAVEDQDTSSKDAASRDQSSEAVQMVNAPVGGARAGLAVRMRKAFLVVFLLGALIQFLLASASDGHVWISILPPAVLMGLYCGYGVSLGAHRTLRESFADSNYYLGFLLTLASLVISLVVQSAEEASAGALGNFGVALVTTLIGLSIRTYLQQFVLDGDEAVAAVQGDLVAAGREMVGRLRAFSDEIAGLRTRISEELKAQNNTVQAEIETSAQHARTQISNLTAASIASVQELENALKALNINGERIASRIEEAFKPLQTTMSGMAGELQASIGALQAQSARWEQVGVAIAAAADGISRMSKASQEAGDVTLRLRQLAEQVAMLAALLTGAANTTEAAVGRISRVADAMGEPGQILRGELAGIAQTVAALRAEVAKAAEATTDLNGAIVEGARVLRDELAAEGLGR